MSEFNFSFPKTTQPTTIEVACNAYQTGRYTDAIKIIVNSAEGSDFDFRTASLYANCLIASGRYWEAITHLDKYNHLYPRNPALLLRRAEVFHYLGIQRKYKAELIKIKELEMTDYSSLIALSSLYIKEKKCKEAYSIINKMRQEKTDDIIESRMVNILI